MRPNNVVCHSSENESWEALQLFSVEVRKIFFCCIAERARSIVVGQLLET